VFHLCVAVEALTDNLSIAHQHRSHHGIGAGECPATLGQIQGVSHETPIVVAEVGIYSDSNNDSMYCSAENSTRSSTFSPTPT
jgi:hypothetical protein